MNSLSRELINAHAQSSRAVCSLHPCCVCSKGPEQLRVEKPTSTLQADLQEALVQKARHEVGGVCPDTSCGHWGESYRGKPIVGPWFFFLVNPVSDVLLEG